MDNLSQETNQAKNSNDFSEIISLYSIVCTKHSQEGDGIWSRFNLMLAVDTAILGVFTFMYSADPRPLMWRELGIGLSVVGIIVGVWSLFVLHELWLWHEHWRDMAIKLEYSFPQAWVKPFTDVPFSLKRDALLFRKPLLAYTQPLILIFLLLWIGLLALLLQNQL